MTTIASMSRQTLESELFALGVDVNDPKVRPLEVSEVYVFPDPVWFDTEFLPWWRGWSSVNMKPTSPNQRDRRTVCIDYAETFRNKMRESLAEAEFKVPDGKSGGIVFCFVPDPYRQPDPAHPEGHAVVLTFRYVTDHWERHFTDCQSGTRWELSRTETESCDGLLA